MSKTSEKISRLKKKCDELWSKAVRTRDGRCLLCGKTEGLAAHHYIHTKGSSLHHRHNVKNGITLCFACHIYKVHTQATVAVLDEVKRAAVMYGVATPAEIEAIENDRSLEKLGVAELEERKKYLQDYLEQLDGDFYKLGGTNND